MNTGKKQLYEQNKQQKMKRQNVEHEHYCHCALIMIMKPIIKWQRAENV